MISLFGSVNTHCLQNLHISYVSSMYNVTNTLLYEEMTKIKVVGTVEFYKFGYSSLLKLKSFGDQNLV